MIPRIHSSSSEAGARRLPPVTRLTVTLGFVGIVALLPRMAWNAHAAAAAALLVAVLLSRVRIATLTKRLLCLEPFVLGVSLLSLLQPDGLSIFLALLTKSTLCLAGMVLLSATTPFSEIIAGLGGLRVPALLFTTLALMYRYLFVLAEETQRMQRARKSRTFVENRARLWASLATVAAQLFIRSSERAERIYAAMCARGWKT